ncbi:hypothetical protein LTR84_001112 [Exophiala bonariae]|uniref:Hypercellular protein HypA n=1 Tax=Exophiala bonariae TaxID=1690606 RepID=A0AAV9NSK8_9EURO|nr:hypothetical protein LTR84_001112 [Exophiala bonariae]
MGYNPFLPTAGAKINTLCVPAGLVHPDRFQEFIKILRSASIVKLRVTDTSNRQLTQDGTLFFDLAATQDGSRADMFPLEPNGKTQVLLGLVDGRRLERSLEVGESASNGTDAALEIVRSQFSELLPDAPGLVVRQLVVFQGDVTPPSEPEILFIPENDGDEAVFDTMVQLAQRWTRGVSNLLKSLKDKPISMVPVGSSQGFPRMSKSLVPTMPEGSSTHTTAKSSSPISAFNEPEAQSDTSRGRFSIVQGIYNLQSGLWLDALTSLSDGAALALENQDHLWHGKALECLLVSMLLLSWSNKNYTIPQICRTLPNRSGIFGADSTSQAAGSLKSLAQLIPPLVETILELYAKISNLDLGGSLQDLLRESRVRHVNLLVIIKGEGCVLNRIILDHLVSPRDRNIDAPVQSEGEFVSISRAGLANNLIEALQTSQSSNNLSHYTSMLVAVASSLSILGLERKHAFYLKQLMQQFAPKLVEARKLGASEVGVHPAAGLPPLSNAQQGVIPEMVIGTRVMLSLAASAYGVALPSVPSPSDKRPADVNNIREKLAIWATEQTSGDVLLKIEMLRVCVSVCEALPDIPAGLHFTSNILRTAKQTLTMSTQSKPQVPIISTDEQVRLMESMRQAVSAASRLGADGYRAEYWDDFLVRDVRIFEKDGFSTLIAHKPSDLSIRASGMSDAVRDPFIYNPFSKDKSITSAPVLVAGELATFAVVLQNPLEMEVDIEEISLITNGSAFQASPHGIVLGPFSIQTFTFNGRATADGELEVIGCRARVRNCYEQEFLTFVKDWKVPFKPKQKAVTKGRFRAHLREVIDEVPPTGTGIVFEPPEPTTLRLKVINAQPRLIVKSSTLEQPSIMLLEGECRSFTVTLSNTSATVAADLLLMTTEDSVMKQLKEALSNKDLNPVEIFEVQSQIATKPAISVKKIDATNPNTLLPPNQDITYNVEVWGRAGLVSAAVHADYAFLGSQSSEVKETFYTRQIRFPLAITVNGSIEIPRCNILSIQSDFAWSSDYRPNSLEVDHDNTASSLPRQQSIMHHWLQEQSDASDYCMMSLDLRNVWPQPLDITLQARKLHTAEEELGESSWKHGYTVHETLQPGVVTRVVLLLPRIFVEDPYIPIPSLDTQKQFVVSTVKMSPEAEASSRESFWYRESLLKCLRGTWIEGSSGRQGEIDLRKGIRLSPRMVEALKMDHVAIDYDIAPCSSSKVSDDGQADLVKQAGKSHFIIRNEAFATLKVRVRNHTQDTLHLLLRLQPSLRHQPHNIALDLSKRFAWSGVLQRALRPAIEPGGMCETELGIIPLVEGNYDIYASVEEIKARGKGTLKKTLEGIGGGAERRIWRARSPCLIDAVGV